MKTQSPQRRPTFERGLWHYQVVCDADIEVRAAPTHSDDARTGEYYKQKDEWQQVMNLQEDALEDQMDAKIICAFASNMLCCTSMPMAVPPAGKLVILIDKRGTSGLPMSGSIGFFVGTYASWAAASKNDADAEVRCFVMSAIFTSAPAVLSSTGTPALLSSTAVGGEAL